MSQAVPMPRSAIAKPNYKADDNSPCRPEKYSAMPKCKPEDEATECTSCGNCIEKSTVVFHAEKLHSTLSGFFADLDNVTLDVADFEELGVATILNRSG